MSCSSEQAEYFPLQSGHLWEYQESLTIRDEVHERRKLIQSGAPIDQGGQRFFTQEYQGKQHFFFSKEKDGIYRYNHQLKKRQLIFPLTVKAAIDSHRSWNAVSRLGVIESRTFAREDRILVRPPKVSLKYTVIENGQTISVPAGTFKNCLLIQAEGVVKVRTDRGNNSAEVTVKNQDWYAPGVGLIKTTREEISDSVFLKPGYYSLELARYE